MLADDHRRLEALLAQTGSELSSGRVTVYDEFRRGLLRHIGIEEKVLAASLKKLMGGSAELIASRLRLDHGAIAALLVPPPSRQILAALIAILEKHNTLEEGRGGFYDICDALPAAEVERLAEEARTAPAVPLSPAINNPNALEATRRALARAGYNLDDYNR
jgi:hypothetical protein